MVDNFKYFDRFLTFITNNKLVSLLFPLFVGSAIIGGSEVMSLQERVIQLESTSEKAPVPVKTEIILQKTDHSCKDTHDEIKLKLAICLKHIRNH